MTLSAQDIDPDTSVHDLLNEATEWMQYASGVAGCLAELVHESDTVDCRRMALALEAIGAMARMGTQCASQAHTKMHWEQQRT